MWPNIARGETHQRDLDVDDETGAEEAYAGAVLSEMRAKNGCGGASVVIPRGQHGVGWPLLVFSAAGLVLALHWLARDRRKGAPAAGVAFVLLFAAPYEARSGESESERVEVVRTLAMRRLAAPQRHEALADASGSDSARVRMAAAAVLERAGTREDRAIAAKLARDGDPEVRRLGRRALQRLHSAPPRERLAHQDPNAQRRLAELLGGAETVVAGEVVSAGARMHKGLIWSRYLVHGAERITEVEIPGGSLGELTQIVSEQEAPSDGDILVVALRGHGPHRWAHLRDGTVFGGWLGEGPGIAWQP
jgi:hypothetical protein